MLTDRISMRDADTGWRCLNPLEPLSTLCPSAREPDWANDRGSQMGVGVSQDPCRSYFAGRQAARLPPPPSRIVPCEIKLDADRALIHTH